MKVRPVVAVVAAGLVFACLPALASAAYNVSWSAWDLSSVVGDTAIAGRPAPFRDPGNGQQLIFANTPSGNLVEFDRSPDGHWKPYDISAMAKSTLIAGDPVPVIDPQTHHLLAVADSPSGDLVQFDRSPNGSWAPYNLTNDVGRKTIVGNPVPIVDPQSNDLLVVARGTEGHLLQWDRVKTTFVWHVYDQTNNAGATIDGNPVPVVDPSDGDLLVFATGGGGHLLVFNRAAATFVWTYGDLTSITGARVVGVADPVVDPAFGYLLVFTDTPSEHLDMFLRTSNGTWAPFDLTSITSGPEIAATPAAFQNPANGDFDVFDASVGEHMVEFERQLTAVPPPVVVTVPPPKPTPHHHLRLVNVKVTFRWTIYFNRTLIHWVRFGRMSSRARVEFECRGRGCPWRKRTSTTRKLRRLKRAIDSRSFRPGDRLSITITEPGRVAERAELRFRAGARPSVGRL